jgi:hypothetical protein
MRRLSLIVLPPEIAVYVDRDHGAVYMNPGALNELPSHPPHDNFFRGPDRPRRPARGRPCHVDVAAGARRSPPA